MLLLVENRSMVQTKNFFTRSYLTLVSAQMEKNNGLEVESGVSFSFFVFFFFCFGLYAHADVKS